MNHRKYPSLNVKNGSLENKSNAKTVVKQQKSFSLIVKQKKCGKNKQKKPKK